MDLFLLVVGSCAFAIILISLIIGCSMCQSRSGFKDFSDAVELETPSGVYTVEDDTMFAPPFDSVPNVPHKVEFEPLPPVNRIKHVLMSSELLPKISLLDRKELGTTAEYVKCEFSRNQVQYIKELGSGWFGKALLGEAAKISVGMKRTKVVIKQLNEDASQEECAMFMEEVKPYRELNHPNILSLLGECTEINPYLTILQYYPMGDLKSFLLGHKEQRSSLAQQGILLNFACDLAAGLACLHQYKYIHHDLALRNCLVTADMSVKIGDYGVAEDLYKADYYTVGCEAVPVRWCAPETIEVAKKQIVVKPFTLAANVWSFGVCLWEIFEFGRQPYCELSNENVIEHVILQKRIRLPKPFLHTADVQHMDKLYELMERSWLKPADRPEVALLSRILQHVKCLETQSQHTTGFDDQWNRLLAKSERSVPATDSSNANGQLHNSDRCFSSDFLPSPSELTHQHDIERLPTQDEESRLFNGEDDRDDSFSSPALFKDQSIITSTPIKSPPTDSSEYATANSVLRTHGMSNEVSEYNSFNDSTVKESDNEPTLPISKDGAVDTIQEPISV